MSEMHCTNVSSYVYLLRSQLRGLGGGGKAPQVTRVRISGLAADVLRKVRKAVDLNVLEILKLLEVTQC